MEQFTEYEKIGVVGIFALLLVREVFRFLGPFLEKRNGRPQANGPSGEKSVEFWKEAIRAVVKEALEPTNEHLKAIRANLHTTNNAIGNMTSEILLELAKSARKQ